MVDVSCDCVCKNCPYDTLPNNTQDQHGIWGSRPWYYSLEDSLPPPCIHELCIACQYWATSVDDPGTKLTEAATTVDGLETELMENGAKFPYCPCNHKRCAHATDPQAMTHSRDGMWLLQPGELLQWLAKLPNYLGTNCECWMGVEGNPPRQRENNGRAGWAQASYELAGFENHLGYG